MASRPTEAVPISGRVDRDGRLVEADAPLERLQVEAGSALGRPLALPQLAALARAAASLGVPLSRALVAADSHHDLDLFVRAEPQRDGVVLTIERWVSRPAAPPRLSLVESMADDEAALAASGFEFATDEGLNLIEISSTLADLLGRDAEGCIGQPLTALFRLVEESDGGLPLLAALATRARVEAQRAVVRGGAPDEYQIDADPLTDAAGKFIGFHAVVRREGELDETPGQSTPMFEESLDEALRSPLARIISAADHIVERGDGPLRSDYANYASDFAAAWRHLLSVIRSMGDGGSAVAQRVDLAKLAIEAVALVQPLADARRIELAIDTIDSPLLADGEARAIVQVLVNILGNAIRHSPDQGTVAVVFEREPGECRVTVADQGPGIARHDQQRIFDRYARVGDAPDGSGLGLAISQRLARSMGGDITLESAPSEGARFTLILPSV
ncbi:MAG: PAS domain-containing sensor histidine kinase [Sphingomonas bacterium]|nr:PAS domain-containing sensor histidine kinase [Sphingomonas bacterium]